MLNLFVAVSMLQTVATGVIWNDLRVGMTKKEVKAMYPKASTKLAGDCDARVEADFTKGKLVRVNLRNVSGATDARCGELVATTLAAKYGPPLRSQREIKLNDCGSTYGGGLAASLAKLCESMGGNEPEYSTLTTWQGHGVEIILKREVGDETIWSLVYRPIVTASQEAASKL